MLLIFIQIQYFCLLSCLYTCFSEVASIQTQAGTFLQEEGNSFVL